MASKKFDTNSLMKNFIPEVGEPEKENNISDSAKQTQDMVPPAPAPSTTPDKQNANELVFKTLQEKEKTKPITFHMPESTNRRMMQYLYERKLAGEKITVTQILNDALIKYLDELGI